MATGWLIPIAIFGLLHLSIFISTRIAKYREGIAPCKHGFAGAKLAPTKCVRCTDENRVAARQAEEDRRRKHREEAVRKQREYDQWLAKILVSTYLQGMDPQQFEVLVCRLYQKLGYEVQQTRYTADHGIDGIIKKDGRIGILQCKRYKGSVGEPALRDLAGTVHNERAHYGLAVTTGNVSRQAKHFAHRARDPIHIIELDELVGMLKTAFPENDVVPENFKADAIDAPILCPKCGKPMRLRKGRRGRFYGCSGYPQCTGTRSA